MELRREWQIPSAGIYLTEAPASAGECGWSFQWRCHCCGQMVAQVDCYQGTQHQAFRFIAVRCFDCGVDGHPRDVPGELQMFQMGLWKIPKPILDYQLSVELAFLDHPEHPHNKEYSK